MSTVEKIFNLIQQRGLSQIEVAKGAGISAALFPQWKKGLQNPSLKTLQKLADYFEVPLNYFYNEIIKTPSSKDEGVDEDVLDVLNKLDQAGITAEKLSQLTDEQFIKLGAYLEGLLDSVQNK